jgi:hypothetical protein
MRPVIASYREFAPSEALRDYVRAFFSFIPGAERTSPQRPTTYEVLFRQGDSFCPPMFADGHASMVFSLGMTCHADGVWQSDPTGWYGKVIGAVSGVNPACPERPAMIGVYFHAAQLASFTSVPACELTDRDVDLTDLWGKAA